MAEYGTVKQCIGDDVELELTRSEACRHCNACLPSLTDKKMILRARNDCRAQAGDTVAVEVKQSGFLSAVLLLYFIPALFFLLGIWLFGTFLANEFLILGLSVVLVALSWLAVHRLAPRLNQSRYLPHAVRILPPAGSVRESDQSPSAESEPDAD